MFTDMPQASFNIYVANTTKSLDTDSMVVKSSSALNEFTKYKETFDTDPLFKNREIKEGNCY
jgi:hypothetical protein